MFVCEGGWVGGFVFGLWKCYCIAREEMGWHGGGSWWGHFGCWMLVLVLDLRLRFRFGIRGFVGEDDGEVEEGLKVLWLWRCLLNQAHEFCYNGCFAIRKFSLCRLSGRYLFGIACIANISSVAISHSNELVIS